MKRLRIIVEVEETEEEIIITLSDDDPHEIPIMSKTFDANIIDVHEAVLETMDILRLTAEEEDE